MNIGLHLGTARGFGSRGVCQNILRSLAASDRGHRFVAWLPAEWGWHDATEPLFGDNVTLRPTQPGTLQKFYLENVRIRAALRSDELDVLFSMSDTGLPLCRVPHLLLIHQAHLAYAPSEFEFPSSRALRTKMRLMDVYLRAALPTVSRLTVQTAFMRDRIAERYSFPHSRIDVVPHAIPRAATLPDPAADPDRIDGAYVCFVASAGPHKNHVVLAPMMAALGDRLPELLCRVTVTAAGAPALAAEATRLGVLDRFVFEGAVPSERAARLIRDAVAMVMPSHLESFGLPYYEAMSLGCPVIAADRPFAREACGDAALYAGVTDGAAFADAVVSVATDPTRATEMSAAGQARFAETERSWDDVATAYLDLLEGLGACRE